jgi:lysophospholipase L1-like esterase
MSCAGGGPTTEDNILTPSEAAAVNSLLTRMNAHIKQQARRHHFAHFALEALYGRRDLKAPFDVIALMTTPKPYGLFISIDGTHPSGEGARILAEAAARALDDRYDLHIHPGYRTLIASR